MTLPDPASTYAGTHLTVAQLIQYGWDGGFHSEDLLLAVVAIAIAESSAVTQARNWHPEYGYRPSTDVIGVQGPDDAWNGATVTANNGSVTHTAAPPYVQQMNADRGCWQISSKIWPAYSDATCDDPTLALAGPVRDIYEGGDGRGWNQWDTYLGGAAQAHYDAASGGWPALRPLVRAFIAAQSSFVVPTVVTDQLGVDHLMPGHPGFVLGDTFTCTVTADSDTLSAIKDGDGNAYVPKAGWVGAILMFTDESTVGSPAYPRGLTFPVPVVRSVDATHVRLLSKARYTKTTWSVSLFADVSDPLHAWMVGTVASGVDAARNVMQFRADETYPLEEGWQVGSAATAPPAFPKIVDATGATVWDRAVPHYWHDLDVDLNGATLKQFNNVNQASKYVYVTATATAGSAALTSVAFTTNPQNENLAAVGQWAVGQKIINPSRGPWDTVDLTTGKVATINPTCLSVDTGASTLTANTAATMTTTGVTLTIGTVTVTGDTTAGSATVTNLASTDAAWAGQVITAAKVLLIKKATSLLINAVSGSTVTLASPAQFSGPVSLHWLDYEVMKRRENGFGIIRLISPGYWPAYSVDPTNAVYGAGVNRRMTFFTSRPGGGVAMSRPGGVDAVHAGREPWFGISLIGTEDVTFDGLQVRSTWSDFVYLNKSSVTDARGNIIGNFHNRRLTIQNCDCASGGRQGITIQDAVDTVIHANTLRGVAHQVFDSEQPWGSMLNVTISNNTISATGYGFFNIAAAAGKTGVKIAITDLTTVAGSNQVTSTATTFQHGRTGSMLDCANLPAGTYVKEWVGPHTLNVSAVATASGTAAATLWGAANWRDLFLKDNTITGGSMVCGFGGGNPDPDGNPVHRGPLVVSGNVNVAGRQYRGGSAPTGGRNTPLIQVSRWDNVAIIGNQHDFVPQSAGRAPQAGTGYYLNGPKYYPGGTGYADPLDDTISTSYVVSANRWNGAIDTQLLPLHPTTTALVVSPNPSPTVATALGLTATVTGALGTPTGVVVFSDGDTIFDTVTLDGSGVATTTIAGDTFAAGAVNITATYEGDTTYAGSEETDFVPIAAASLAFMGCNGDTRTFGQLFGGGGKAFGDYGT